ncbi:MAG: nicotinamidase-related amidase [Porticoccaceae bacterium]|jgi:nicotinamidase-related amidase
MTNKNFKIGLVGFVVAMIAFIGFAFTNKESLNGNQKSANFHETDHTTFKVENTVLVLVDHQLGTIGWAGELANKDEQDQLKMWVRTMARFAKSAGIPVILTSSLESESQGPLLPEFKEILPAEYAARIQRTGVINAWDDPKFVAAIKATGKNNIIMGGLTTDVCLVPPALSAQANGYNVVALLDISAACTKIAAQNSRDLLQKAGIEIMTVTPMITSMLGNYKNPASGGFFGAFEKEGVYSAFAKGNLR